jgi:hypothetical protein
MNDKHAAEMLACFGPLDSMLQDLIKRGSVQELIALPEPMFNLAMARIRRLHLEAKGYKFMDADDPASPCASCEG